MNERSESRHAASEALISEFGTQYLADELPSFTPEFVHGVLPAWARASAKRLVHSVGGDVDGILELLDALRSNREHPMITKLNDASSMEWNVEDEDWNIFVRILDYMLRSIEALRC